MKPVALVVVGLLLGLGAFAMALGRVGAGGSPSSVPLRARDGPYRGSEPPGGIRLAPFTLRSYRGGPVSSGSLRGKVVALTFLESKCTEACPIIAAEIARGIDRLPARDRAAVRAIAISTHPIDDTRTSVRRFLAARRAIGRLDYLIGSERELRPVWRRYHVLSALESGSANTHSASVHIYDRDGVWVSSLHPGIDLTTRNFVHDVQRALRAS